MGITMTAVAELLRKHDKFVITAHVNPDGDAVGSMMAIYYLLTALDKQAECLIDDDIDANLQIIPGCGVIRRPRPGESLAPDLLIVLDCSDISRIGTVNDVVTAPVLNIDHHASNDGTMGQYVYLDSQRAATGEILYQLYEHMGVDIDEATAVCLYTAIATDCGFFRYSNTSSFTMECGARLIKRGVKPNIIAEAMEMRSAATVRSIAMVLNTLDIAAGGKVASIIATEEILANCDSTEGFVDIVRAIEGVDIAVLLKFVEPGCTRVSMRSKNTDVSAIAVKLGGGGHKKAAGCTIYESTYAARDIIRAECERALRGGAGDE